MKSHFELSHIISPDPATKRYLTPQNMPFSDKLTSYFISPSKVFFHNLQEGHDFTYYDAFSKDILFELTQSQPPSSSSPISYTDFSVRMCIYFKFHFKQKDSMGISYVHSEVK